MIEVRLMKRGEPPSIRTLRCELRVVVIFVRIKQLRKWNVLVHYLVQTIGRRLPIYLISFFLLGALHARTLIRA